MKQILLFLLIALGLFSRSVFADLSEQGFDVVFVIDDSSSMGTKRSSNGKSKSDAEGRRYTAVNMLMSKLYEASEDSFKTKQVDLDVRFTTIAFGTDAQVVFDWQKFSYNDSPIPKWKNFAQKDRVWTDFENAFKKIVQQIKKINYGVTDTGMQRELVLILLTDGEPSIKRNQNNLYKEQRLWDQLDRYLEAVRQNNQNFKFFLIALNAQIKYWPKVGQYWTDLGAKHVQIDTDRVNNEQLYNSLQEQVISALYPFAILTPNQNGEFDVPCFQETMYFKFFFYDGKRHAITLISPSGKKIIDRQQPGYGGDKTYMQFSVDKPEVGRWKISNYLGKSYDVRYSTVPFGFSYIYPDKSHVFLPIAKKIELAINRTDKPFTVNEINNCKLKGNLKIESKDKAFNKTLAIDIGIDQKNPNRLNLITKQSFLADPKYKDLDLDFELTSFDKLVFKKEQQRFNISNKKLVRLDLKTKTTAAYFNNDEIKIEVRVGLNMVENNSPVAINDIFLAPDDSLLVDVNCYSKQCNLIKDDKSKAVLLKQLDKNTLSADIIVKQQSNKSWLSDLVSKATGIGDKLNIKLKAKANLKINDEKYLLLPPAESF